MTSKVSIDKVDDECTGPEEETKSSDVEKELEEDIINSSSPTKFEEFTSPEIIKEKSKVTVMSLESLIANAWSPSS
jgi:hypothetical protein